MIFGAFDLLRVFIPRADIHDSLCGLHEKVTKENISRQGADGQLWELHQLLLRRVSFPLGTSSIRLNAGQLVEARCHTDDVLSQ
jgi:hypothetical protein